MLKRVLIGAVVAAGLVALTLLGLEMFQVALRSEWVLFDQFVRLDRAEAVERLELRDAAGSVVWVLENPEGREVHEIDYGIVPEGFVQSVPAEGAPRALVTDEDLVLAYFLPGDRFARIEMRPVSEGRYYRSVTMTGVGCRTWSCVEMLDDDPRRGISEKVRMIEEDDGQGGGADGPD